MSERKVILRIEVVAIPGGEWFNCLIDGGEHVVQAVDGQWVITGQDGMDYGTREFIYDVMNRAIGDF
jgi:hypothetical protein